jgi:hypothetical protein
MRRASKLALIPVAVLAGAGLAIVAAAVDSDRRLHSLGDAAVSDCRGRNPPLRPPEATREQEIDNGIVHFLIDDKGIRSRWLYAASYYVYEIAARLKTTPEQRRNLYARLPCGVRPKMRTRPTT